LPMGGKREVMGFIGKALPCISSAGGVARKGHQSKEISRRGSGDRVGDAASLAGKEEIEACIINTVGKN